MQVKNPFCTGTELVVLRITYDSSISSLRAHHVAHVARKAGMSAREFAAAVMQLERAGHIRKDSYGYWRLGETGKVLLACANELALVQKVS